MLTQLTNTKSALVHLTIMNIVGTDEQGNKVTGEVEVEGKSGSGLIIYSNTEEILVEVEWSGHGILKAVDEEGNEYELQTTK